MSNIAALGRLSASSLLGLALLCAPAFAADPAPADAKPEPKPVSPAQKAALDRLKRPGGTGGCILFALPKPVMLEAVNAAANRQPTPAAFKNAVPTVTSQCTTRPYSGADDVLISTVFSAVQIAGLSVRLAHQFALAQDRLDSAWAQAEPKDKAGFYAAADLMLTPGPAQTPVVPDVSPLARAAGVAPDQMEAAAPLLRVYYLSLATLERTDPILAPQAKAPAPR